MLMGCGCCSCSCSGGVGKIELDLVFEVARWMLLLFSVIGFCTLKAVRWLRSSRSGVEKMMQIDAIRMELRRRNSFINRSGTIH